MNKRDFAISNINCLLKYKFPSNINVRNYDGKESLFATYMIKGYKYFLELYDGRLLLSCTAVNPDDGVETWFKAVADDLTDKEICDFKIRFYDAKEQFENKCLEIFDYRNTCRGNVGTVPTDARIQQDKMVLETMDNLVDDNR